MAVFANIPAVQEKWNIQPPLQSMEYNTTEYVGNVHLELEFVGLFG